MRSVDLAVIQSRVEELSGQMQKALSALSASMAESAKPSPQASTPAPQTDQDVLRDLEAQLATLRRDAGVLANSIAAERGAAEECERREHAATFETLDAERSVVEEIGDSLDKVVTELRERVG